MCKNEKKKLSTKKIRRCVHDIDTTVIITINGPAVFRFVQIDEKTKQKNLIKRSTVN